MKGFAYTFLFTLSLTHPYTFAAPNDKHAPEQAVTHAVTHAATHAAPEVYRMHHVDVPHTSVNHQTIVRDNIHVTRPTQDDKGRQIAAKEYVQPPQHNVVTHNVRLVTRMTNERNHETQTNHFYWHQDQQMKYTHYRDNHQQDWYGFYQGKQFYWTRYHDAHWWWYDQKHARWAFWGEGFWWWPSPSGALYVYVDNDYYPYVDNQNGVTVVEPETTASPNTIPEVGNGVEYDSADQTRMVQLSGNDNEAFLFDTTGTNPTLIKYLGNNVTDVAYSTSFSNKALQILLKYQDGSFALFDANGNSLNTPPAPNAVNDFPESATVVAPPEPEDEDTDYNP